MPSANDDCSVLCVLDSLDTTILRGWSIKFYKNREYEFANAVGVSDYWVEHWNITSGALVGKIHL